MNFKLLLQLHARSVSKALFPTYQATRNMKKLVLSTMVDAMSIQ